MMAVPLFRNIRRPKEYESRTNGATPCLTKHCVLYSFILRKAMYYVTIYALSLCKMAYIAKRQATPPLPPCYKHRQEGHDGLIQTKY